MYYDIICIEIQDKNKNMSDPKISPLDIQVNSPLLPELEFPVGDRNEAVPHDLEVNHPDLSNHRLDIVRDCKDLEGSFLENVSINFVFWQHGSAEDFGGSMLDDMGLSVENLTDTLAEAAEAVEESETTPPATTEKPTNTRNKRPRRTTVPLHHQCRNHTARLGSALTAGRRRSRGDGGDVRAC